MHFYFTIYHSQPSCPIRLKYLLIIWKFPGSLLLFLCMLGDAQMMKVLKSGILGLADIGVLFDGVRESGEYTDSVIFSVSMPKFA